MYKQPNVYSSYYENDLGRTLYTVVMALKPCVIVEIGTLYGYSAISMAQALRDLGGYGRVECYDLWDTYEYKHCSITDACKNVLDHGVERYIKLCTGDLERAISDYHSGEHGFKENVLFHIDISNHGDIIKHAVKEIGNECLGILFEGGTEERNNIKWMKEFDKPPITLECCDYRVIDERFPGLSLV